MKNEPGKSDKSINDESRKEESSVDRKKENPYAAERQKCRNADIKVMAQLALLTTIALTIFVIESAIPVIVPVPGVKLGLANIVTLFVIKRYGVKQAGAVLVMRIVLATIFTGQAVSFMYSIFGGMLCLVTMGMVNKILSGKYIFLTSILGAVAHNVGQILAALCVLKLSGILAYVPFLVISGIVTGLFTGLVCYYADKYIPNINEM